MQETSKRMIANRKKLKLIEEIKEQNAWQPHAPQVQGIIFSSIIVPMYI